MRLCQCHQPYSDERSHCCLAWSTSLLLDLHLSVVDGIALVITLVLCLGWLVWQGRSVPNDEIGGEFQDHVQTSFNTRKTALVTLTALVVLLVSSKTLVWGAVEIAGAAQVSELMIGLSIIAVGTSLPELAATIACVLRREFGLAIGNVVGSNLFNALAVLGIVAIVSPGDVEAAVRNRDAVVHIALTCSACSSFAFAGVHRRDE